ncbi:MAG: helix-turn-helix protein [Acidobacteriota bacterium]|jgi:tetratricopeptide (TPR) repeat protein|nr:helix-turn-helix protein [Acidobacteriota bacterium]
MEPKIPPPMGLALTLLRSVLGWGQKQLAAAFGTSSKVISDYERGQKPLSREKLDEMVRVLGLPPEATEEALEFQRRMQAMSRAPGYPDDAERQQIERVAVEAGKSLEDGVRTVFSLITVEGRALAARQRARQSWERLKRQPSVQRRASVEKVQELRSWALCELVCAESIKAAADDADRAVELAELAVRVAELIPGEQAWRWRVQGYAWAHLGNARRVKGDLPMAEEGFVRSGKLWEDGAPGDPGLLDEAVILSLEVSLRIEQNLLQRGSVLLDRALKADKGPLKKNLLLQKARLLEWSGDYEGAVSTLRQVTPFISDVEEPRLLCIQRFNLGANLCHVGRYQEAEALLPELRGLTVRLGNGLDSVRLRWLEGRISSGLGRVEEALSALSLVRSEFASLGIAYDAAVATLELSVLYLEQGRNEEVQVLSRQMAPIFQMQGVHREALAALNLFGQAAERKAVTVKLARRLVEYLYRARHNPSLKFEAGE